MPVCMLVVVALVVMRLMRAALFLVVVPVAMLMAVALVVVAAVAVVHRAARVAARSLCRRGRLCFGHLLRCLRGFGYHYASGLFFFLRSKRKKIQSCKL